MFHISVPIIHYSCHITEAEGEVGNPSSIFMHGLFCRFVLQNWQLYRKSKIFRLFDSALTFLVLKQMRLDGHT